MLSTNSALSSFGKPSILGQALTGLGPKDFYSLLSQAALLPKSDAGRNGVKPVSGFVIQNRQTFVLQVVPDAWARFYDLVCGLLRLRDLVSSETPFVHERMELPCTPTLAIELNSSCSGPTHSNRPGAGHGYESMELRCTPKELSVPSMIRLLGIADALFGKVI